MKSAILFTALGLLCMCAFVALISFTSNRILDSNNSRALSKEVPIGSTYGTTLLLGIFSVTGKKYAERRRYIRDTYLATGDDRICKLEEFKIQAKGKFSQRRCKIAYTFVIGAGGSDRPNDHDDSEPLTLDIDQNGNADEKNDCVYLNIKENMEEGKSTTYMKLGASLSDEWGFDYISKIDDDSVLAIELLLQLMEDDLPPMPYNRRTYGGGIWASYAHHHMYAPGQFYFMSADLAHYVSNEITPEDRRKKMHWRHTEDADMGSFVFSNERPIKYINLNTQKIWAHPMKTEKEFRSAWASHRWKLPQYGVQFPFGPLCRTWLQGNGV